MALKAISWDNDGTILGAKDPNDTSHAAKVLLPNIKEVMQFVPLNIVCSGCKTPESELQNFDPEKVITKFKTLMQQLPIQFAVFSPTVGGMECYVLQKLSTGDYNIFQAHKDPRYKVFIGQFKKPGVGMLKVIIDLLMEQLNMTLHLKNDVLMVGDTWHDQKAAEALGIPFLEANIIHKAVEISALKALIVH